MISWRDTGDENIIHILEDPIKTLQDTVHKSLKHLASISQAEGHAEKLVEAKRDHNGSL